MNYPTKPGDTYTAQVIGTYPELPDYPFDTKEANPQFYFEKDFDEQGNQTMRFGGPTGEVVVTYIDGVFTHARPDGLVLRRSTWNPATSSWDVDKEVPVEDTLPSHDVYNHREGRVCILTEDGTWFVPLDTGGEGYACDMDHGPAQAKLEREVRRLREALVMYAKPESYHAIGFLPDRPCGEFIDDFSEDHGDPFYDRPMPGARARAALQETTEETAT